ncbi:MAG: ATPase, T2SS/T4P/T4SS family [Promethearchaeota archaeon]
MIDNYSKKGIIQTKKVLEGGKRRVLTIECRICPDFSKKFLKNESCYQCVFDNILHNLAKKFDDVHIEALDSSISSYVTNSICDFFKKLESIKKLQKNLLLFKEKCRYTQDFGCKLFKNYNEILLLDKNDLLDPIKAYLKIKDAFKECKKKHPNDSECIICQEKLLKIFIKLLNIFNSSILIQDYNKFQDESSLFKDSRYYYEYLITKTHSSDLINFSLDKKIQKEPKYNIIETYQLGELYQIHISDIKRKTEKKYKFLLAHQLQGDESYYDKLSENVIKKIQVLRFDDTVSLESLIDLYKNEVRRIIDLNYRKMDNLKKDKIILFITIKYLQLEKLFPLLIDDFIEEIFLDSPDSKIYLDHQKYGRCRTDITLSNREIQRIITLLRLYSKQRLDYSNPVLKYVIKNQYFYCRFAIDVRPINVARFSLDIRKLNKNILTIQDLLKNKTLNPLMAAFLYFCMVRRINITVTGETDTGKTTLINAFDLILPEYFRKIYVENVTESLEQLIFNKHQLKYHADSLESSDRSQYTKSNHIKTLLHRTPDVIYLGEILTKEEAQALFHCLAAGLRGFQTIHSNTIDSLINRFIHTFGINYSQLDDLDLLVLMKREFNKRRIASVSEIDLKHFQVGEHNREIFLLDPAVLDWKLLKNLYETRTINRLKKFENINQKSFESFIRLYEEIFDYLLTSDKISNDDLVNLFHELFFYSIISYEDAYKFWNEWRGASKN